MALTVTSPLIVREEADSGTWVGTGSPGIDTDFKFSGSGAIGVDCDIETVRFYSPAFATVNLTGDRLFVAMLCMTQPNLDTKANGGMQIGVRDSLGNESYWYVGGKDTYSGGYEDFACDLGSTPDFNTGSPADITDITNVAVGWKSLAKSRLSKNCFADLFRTGTTGLIITGTNTITDEGWSEVETLAAALPTGIIKKLKPGLYVLKAPVILGDSAGALTTNFTDEATTLVFDDLPVGDDFYGITIVGNATGTTDIKFGSVVGSGDGRQGVQGGSISTAGPSWFWDSATDIADLDTIKIYGANWSGAKRKIELDDSSKTSIISMAFVNCGRINPGDTANGAEILSIAIIDPDDDIDTENRGLRFPATNTIKKVSFITSGSPAIQHFAHLDTLGTYTVTFDAVKYFGNFASGTLWHGENSADNALTATVSKVNGADPITAEFENTGSPVPTTAVIGSVPLTITVKDEIDLSVIQNVQTSIFLKNSPFTQLMNEDTTAAGIATESYAGATGIDVVWKCRKSDDLDNPRYFPKSSIETIASGGLNITVLLKQNTFI